MPIVLQYYIIRRVVYVLCIFSSVACLFGGLVVRSSVVPLMPYMTHVEPFALRDTGETLFPVSGI